MLSIQFPKKQNVLQYFGGTRDTIRQFRLFLPKLWKCQITLDREISSSPDTLRMVHAGFASLVWSTITKSTLWGQTDLTWSSAFLYPKWNFLNPLVTILWSSEPSPLPQKCFWLLVSARYSAARTVKHMFLNSVTLHIHLRRFEITNRMKQCSMCK